MKQFTIYLVSLILLIGCQESKDKNTSETAHELLAKSIEAHGGTSFYNATVTFNLKELKYKLERRNNLSNFSVVRTSDTTTYKATYENGFGSYYVNDSLQEETLYSRRFIDSRLEGFVYVLSFPFVLDQNAIQLERKPDVIIRRKPYHVLHASYKQVEGIENTDEFYLYIDPETDLIAFTAERYELVGGSKLFRRNFNQRTIEGLTFFDSHIFRHENRDRSLDSLYLDYDIPNMKAIKTQELTDITVQLHPSIESN